MKRMFTFTNGTVINADADDLKRLLNDYKEYVQNYTELLGDLENEEYIARGNGFCDRKFSESFINGQIDKYSTMAAELETWLAETKKGV